MNAPLTRTVDQFDGSPSKFFQAMRTADEQLNAIARAQQEAADAKAEVARLTEKLTNARCEIDDLQQDKRDMGDLIARLTKSEAAYAAERDELVDQVEDMQREVRDAREALTRVAELEAELEELAARDDAVDAAAEASEDDQ